MNEDLKKYIDQARQHGLSDSTIRENLAKAGWAQAQINEALPHVAPGAMAQTPVASPMGSAAAQPDASPAKRRQMSLATGVIIGVVLVAVAGFFVYYAMAKNSPAKIWTQFGSTFAAQTGSKNSHGEESLSISGQAKDNTPFSVSIKDSSDSAHDDKNSSQSTNMLSIGYNGISVDGVEVRLVNNILYANIAKVPVVGDMAKDYDGWVKIDLSSIPSTTGQGGVSTNPLAGLAQLQSTLAKFNVIQAHQYSGAETIEGVKTYHYSLTLNKDSMKNWLNSYVDQQASAGTNNMTSDQATQAKDALSKLVDDLTIKGASIWIGVNDKMLYKSTLDAEFKDTTGQVIGTAPVEISYSGTYSKYGENVSVSAPSKAMDLFNAVQSELGTEIQSAADSQGTTAGQ